MLKVWLDYLAIHRTHGVKIKGHNQVNTRDSVKGLGTWSRDPPSILADSSDKMKAIRV